MSARSWFLGAALALAPSIALAFSAGPAADKVKTCSTSAGACTQCHNNAGTPSSLAVEMWMDGSQVLPKPPGPASPSYLPGSTYSFILKAVEGAAAARCQHGPTTLGCGQAVAANSCAFGFELAAVTAASCASQPVQAGHFLPLGTPASTQIKCGPGMGTPTPACMNPGSTTEYLMHVCASTVNSASPDTIQWDFQWQAPAAGTGPVAFFFGVNSTNANSSSSGDAPKFSADDPTLALVLQEGSSAGTCDLRRASVPSLGPPVDKAGTLFTDTTSCAGESVPATTAVADFGASPSRDVEAVSGGDPLAVYRAVHSTQGCAGGCTGTLYVTKVGTQVHVSLQ